MELNEILKSFEKTAKDIKQQSDDLADKMNHINKWKYFKGVDEIDKSGDKSVTISFETTEERNAFIELFNK